MTIPNVTAPDPGPGGHGQRTFALNVLLFTPCGVYLWLESRAKTDVICFVAFPDAQAAWAAMIGNVTGLSVTASAPAGADSDAAESCSVHWVGTGPYSGLARAEPSATLTRPG